MIIRTLAASCFAGLAAIAHADYQTELALGFSQGDIEVRDRQGNAYDVSQRVKSGTASLYLTPVPTQGVPLSDAAFLSRAAGLSVTYHDIYEGGHNEHQLAAFGRWFMARDTTLKVGYEKFSNDGGFNDEWSGWGVGLGRYFAETSYLEAVYTKLEFDSNRENFRHPNGDLERYQVNFKSVIFSNKQAQMDIELSAIKDDFADELSATLGRYLHHRMKYGATVSLANPDGDPLDKRSLALFLEHFTSERVGLHASLTVVRRSEGFEGGRSQLARIATVGLSARF